jgi:predicted  nucleic acid-binding Zn-ribbon protein
LEQAVASLRARAGEETVAAAARAAAEAAEAQAALASAMAKVAETQAAFEAMSTEFEDFKKRVQVRRPQPHPTPPP